MLISLLSFNVIPSLEKVNVKQQIWFQENKNTIHMPVIAELWEGDSDLE